MKYHFQYPIVGRGKGVPWKQPWYRDALNAAKMNFKKDLRIEGIDYSIVRQNSGKFRPLSDTDFPLVVTTHNDMRLLPSFFRHYRSMGVTRFVCIDDISSDGTPDFILQQPDAELFTGKIRFKDADRGKIWRENVFQLFGHERWYLNVDSDEYFVYDSMGYESIGDFSRRLDSSGVKRVPAPMIDLYPIGGLSGANFSGVGDEMPWEIATHFDGSGYSGEIFTTGLTIDGGPRSRVFKTHVQLMKYPLIRWDRYCSLGRTIHRPKPDYYNFPEVMSAILHFKIFSDIREKAEKAIEQAQHYDQAKVYKAVLEGLRAAGDVDFSYEHSVRYEGVDDLVRRGFILPLTYSGRR